MKFHAVVAALLAVPFTVAQSDTVFLASGTVVEKAEVQSWTIRELKYRKDGSSQSVPTDQVVRVELGDFKDVYRRGVAGGDPDLFLSTARDQQKANKDLMAQLGFVEAARLFYQQGKEANGGSALEEMVAAFPDGGMVPAMYRMKFESYMGRGDAGGFRNASIVAKKLHSEAMTNAWPQGLALEGEFFTALADGATSGTPADFQNKMRQIASQAAGVNQRLAARANVQLADSMRRSGEKDGARRLYESVLEKDSSDPNSRAGAYLGLGLIEMESADASNREPYKAALLKFLRVHLETTEAWDSLQGEALYNAMFAADKWRGQDYALIAGRCRYILLNDFGHTQWAERARAK